MKLCIECDRHLFGPDAECPFCGASQPTSGGQPRSGLAAMTLAVGLGLASCGPQVAMDDTTVGMSDEESGTTEPGATSAMTTVPMTTAATDTSDGTTAASDDVDDSQDDAPCGFYAGCPPEDFGGPLECDVFAQDCPDGEKCMPWANDGGNSWNATRCSPIFDEPDGLDEPCTVEGSAVSGLDSCDLGLMCWEVDPETNEGVCIALCSGSVENPVCADDYVCQIYNDEVLPLCEYACNPLAQDCPEGEGCFAAFEEFPFTCADDVPGAEYPQPCESINGCAAGSTCIPAELVPGCGGVVGCCASFCDLSAPEACPDTDLGMSCTVWNELALPPPGFEDVGVCRLP